jgi:hypothetical protein
MQSGIVTKVVPNTLMESPMKVASEACKPNGKDRAEETHLEHHDRKESQNNEESRLPVGRPFAGHRIDRYPTWERGGQAHELFAFDESLGFLEQLLTGRRLHPGFEVLGSVIADDGRPEAILLRRWLEIYPSVGLGKPATRSQGRFDQVETLIEAIAAEVDVGRILPDRLDPIVDVVKVKLKRRGDVQGALQRFCGRHALGAQLDGPQCGGGDSEEKFLAFQGI